MKRTITLFLLLLLLLPAVAQKPFTARVVAGKDYPYYVTSVEASLTVRVDDEDNKRKYDYKHLYFGKQDNRTYTFSYDAKWAGRIRFRLNVVDQQGVKKDLFNFLEVPVIPGEQLTVTLHDTWDIEIGGSQLYREYGNAWRAILLQDKPAKDYVTKHRKERGCALFALSESPLSGIPTIIKNRMELFDPATISFLGDVKDLNNVTDIMCSHANYERSRISYLRDDPYKRADIEPFDRQLEGQAIIDAVGQKYKGKPTLVSVWTYGLGNDPNAYELYLHAIGMNQVHLTSVLNFDGEKSWRNNVSAYPGTHHLLMRYQVDSLFQLYMPDIEYSSSTGRHFYILLDEEGKVVAHGDRLHNYRQLITLTDQLKAQAGLPPFKEKPYENKYLDLDVAKVNEPEMSDPYVQAKMRMSYHDYLPIEGYDSYRYTTDVLYAATAKQLNVSQRLYDLVRKDIEEQNKQSYERGLQSAIKNEAQRAKMKDGYVPEIGKYKQWTAAHIGIPVDLGLSVKWADMNVGATKPEEAGYFFTWGDVEPITENGSHVWYNYRLSNGSENSLRKYNTQTKRGPVDMRTTLIPEDDAATVYWQGDWRMPTKEEVDELLEKCQWEWTEQNGVTGARVTGPNGNQIFLPATGCYNHNGFDLKGVKGYFWASNIDPANPHNSYYLCCRKDTQDNNLAARMAGRTVRAVCK